MKNKFIVVITLCAIAAGIGGWVYFNQQSKNQPGEVIKIVSPRTDTLRVIINSPGRILPKNRLEIKPPVNGRIEKVLVQEGQKVRVSEILAWMSSTDRAALLDAARGQGEESLKYWEEVYKPIPLVASIDGEVIVGTVQPGQTVTTGDPVLVLSDQLILRAQVDETDIGKIKVKQPASITLDAYPDATMDAVVDHIYYESKTVNNVTVYEVDLKFKEIPAFFRSGMSANVDFVVEEKENVLLVPLEAVDHRRDGAYVLILISDGADPVERPVVLGESNDEDVEIVSGVNADERIVLKNKKYRIPQKSSGSNPFLPAGRRR